MEIELRGFIGRQIIVTGPSFIDNDQLESVKLLAVEDSRHLDRESEGGRQGRGQTAKEAFLVGSCFLCSLWADCHHPGRL